MTVAGLLRSPRLRRELPLLGVTVLVAETLLILGISASRNWTQPALLVGLGLDILLISALLIVWPIRREGGVRPLSLTVPKAVRAVGLGVAVAALGMRWLGLPLKALAALAASAELLLAGLVMLALARVALKRGHGDLWARVREQLSPALPRPVLELALLEFRLMGAAFATLFRRPLPEVPKDAFTTTQRGTYGLMIGALAVVSVMEMAAVHALLVVYLPGRPLVHALLGTVHVYGILWLLGDRRLMLASWHRVEDDALALNLGLRFQARIPYERISRIVFLRDDRERRSVQPRRGRNPRATPLESANVHLCLDRPLSFTTYFGIRRPVEHLDLYVDQPEAFIAALAARTGFGAESGKGSDAK